METNGLIAVTGGLLVFIALGALGIFFWRSGSGREAPIPVRPTSHHRRTESETEFDWIDRRMEAVAEMLARPTPAHDAFSFQADTVFYALCTTSIVTLQAAIKEVLEHLSLDYGTVDVAYVRGLVGHVAHIERDHLTYWVEIDEKYRDDAESLGAILAHECCHIIYDERHLPRQGDTRDERTVDLIAFLCGLGPLTLNAVRGHRYLGYFGRESFAYAYVRINEALGIEEAQAIKWLRSEARALLRDAPHTERPPLKLPYSEAPSRVVVRCQSPECRRRLRVPTGSVLRVTCPRCGKAFVFNGTPCTVDSSR
jgi:hypothetical protein